MTAMDFLKDIEFWIALALVFAAVVSLAMVVAKTVAEATKASEEQLDLAQMSMLSGGEELSPMSRFVSSGRLFRLRVVAGVVPALAVPAVLLSAGVRSPVAIFLPAALFGFVGWRVPLVYFNLLVKRRQALFELDILDLALGLDNALRAGMALPQAIDKIAARMHGVMKEELDVVQREYRLGVDLVQALEHLCRRMPCEDIRLLTSAIRITSEAGGSLAEILHEMAQMIRGRREFQDKVKTIKGRDDKNKCKVQIAELEAALEEAREIRTVMQEAIWLTDKFGEGEYHDINGLCKIATIADIDGKGWSLTPGAYVGVPDSDDDGVDFHTRMREIHDELETLQKESNRLMVVISKNMEEMGKC